MNEPNWSQLQTGEWPSGEGRAIALLRDPAEELRRRFSIEFSAGRDELGGFLQAALQFPSGRNVLLIDRSNGPGTEVWVDAGAQPLDVITDLVRSLGLKVEDVVWTLGQ